MYVYIYIHNVHMYIIMNAYMFVCVYLGPRDQPQGAAPRRARQRHRLHAHGGRRAPAVLAPSLLSIRTVDKPGLTPDCQASRCTRPPLAIPEGGGVIPEGGGAYGTPEGGKPMGDTGWGRPQVGASRRQAFAPWVWPATQDVRTQPTDRSGLLSSGGVASLPAWQRVWPNPT